MRGLITAAALIALALTGTDHNTTPGSADMLDEHGFPPRIEYTGDLFHYCEGPVATEVQPNTSEAKASADRACLRMQLAIERAHWPDSITAVGDTAVNR